jgi:hypothetical protein
MGGGRIDKNIYAFIINFSAKRKIGGILKQKNLAFSDLSPDNMTSINNRIFRVSFAELFLKLEIYIMP